MSFIFRCILSIATLLISFIFLNWGVQQTLQLILFWPLFWFAIICVILLFFIRLLSKYLSVITAFFVHLAGFNQIKILKWILLTIGWGIAGFVNLMNIHSIDFSQTRLLIIGLVGIITNCLVPWEVHARIQAIEIGVNTGKKMATDTIEIANRMTKLIKEKNISYEDTMVNIQLMKNENLIDEMQFRFIVALVKKQTGA